MIIIKFILRLLREVFILKPIGFVGDMHFKLFHKEPAGAQKLSRLEALEAEVMAERRSRAANR